MNVSANTVMVVCIVAGTIRRARQERVGEVERMCCCSPSSSSWLYSSPLCVMVQPCRGEPQVVFLYLASWLMH